MTETGLNTQILTVPPPPYGRHLAPLVSGLGCALKKSLTSVGSRMFLSGTQEFSSGLYPSH